MNEAEPLRACPFCGKPPTIQVHYIGANGKRVQISCEACDYRHPWNREDRAIKRWNKRKARPAAVGNTDDIPGALAALDDFTHRWCVDVAASEAAGELTFRCSQCPFKAGEFCRVHAWAAGHGARKFGAVT